MAVFHVAPGRRRGVSDSESLEPQAPRCQASALGIPGERLNPQVRPFYLEASNSIFPGGSAGKESAHNVGDLGLIPGSGRSLGEGNGYPLQYSCLENSIDRGAWQVTIHGIAKGQTRFQVTNTHSGVLNSHVLLC